MKMFFSGIVAEDVDNVWHVVAPMILRAITEEVGIYELQDVYDGLKAREMQLWVFAVEGSIKACMVTEIRRHPKTQIVHILVLGGDSVGVWEAAKDSWDIFENWALGQGCTFIEALTRPGISKLTRPLGLLKRGEFLRKRLIPATVQ